MKYMRKGVSTTVATVMAIIALVIGVVIGYAATTITATTAEKAGGLKGEVPIGVLLPLSGPLASYATNDKIAAQAAAEEVNAFLEKAGANWRIKLYIEDTELKPAVGLEKLQSLYAKGVRIVIGPMASSVLKQLKEYADSNKILVISQSSTGVDLAIPDDFIYRFPPSDVYQGPIGPRFAKKLGVTHIIFVWRGNTWGDGLERVAEKTAKDLGIQVAGKIRYSPEATEFSAEVSNLVNLVNKLVDQGVAPEKIMVQLISYEEAKAFFLTAADYDILWKVKWFGSDGTAYSSKLLEDPKVAEFVSTVRFVSPTFAPTKTPKYVELTEKIKSETGSAPEPYAYNTYDEVWAIAYALLAVNKYDSETVKNVLPDILQHYYGASGYIVLDKNGDRVVESYELTEIVKTASGFEWRATGTYMTATGEIIWE